MWQTEKIEVSPWIVGRSLVGVDQLVAGLKKCDEVDHLGDGHGFVEIRHRGLRHFSEFLAVSATDDMRGVDDRGDEFAVGADAWSLAAKGNVEARGSWKIFARNGMARVALQGIEGGFSFIDIAIGEAEASRGFFEITTNNKQYTGRHDWAENLEDGKCFHGFQFEVNRPRVRGNGVITRGRKCG